MMQLRINLSAHAFAFAATGALTTISALFNTAGLPAIDWALYVWPLMVLLWAIGFLRAHRRYR